MATDAERAAIKNYLLQRGRTRETQLAPVKRLEGLLESAIPLEAQEVVADTLIDMISDDSSVPAPFHPLIFRALKENCQAQERIV